MPSAPGRSTLFVVDDAEETGTHSECEVSEGRAYVSRMNVKLLGMMFGGTIAEVMGMAGEDLDQIVEAALAAR